ncbi:hypothetical protein P5673_030200 [Acropora cervicornis]|uniref:Uncharacterized protein n=1 Tax=Acropora cervicornis TaxID=6130 RepID=A0AAD9PUM1_ACRCE|nr:hypothetical protein P5673_030200 [Acropora cervicornis]
MNNSTKPSSPPPRVTNSSSLGISTPEHRVGKVNDNGLLLSKCAEHGLCITNTVLPVPAGRLPL